METEKSKPFSTIVLTLILFGVLAGCSSINMQSDGNKRLESYVRERLNRPEVKLTQVDYNKIKSVKIHHAGNMDDISLLSKMKNLEHLDLTNGKILEDISPLSNLEKLRRVVLFGNKVSDLKPLSKLVNLEELDLTYCPVTDIRPLFGLGKLRDVILGKGEIPEEQLAKFKSLHPHIVLSYKNQPPEDRIKRAIRRRYNKIGAELTQADYDEVKIVVIPHAGNMDDISLLSKMKNLEHLDLTNGGILKDISPLSNLEKLRRVILFGNKVSDLKPLSKLVNLEELDLTNCPVTDIRPLFGLKSLKRVKIAKEVAGELKKALPNASINQ